MKAVIVAAMESKENSRRGMREWWAQFSPEERSEIWRERAKRAWGTKRESSGEGERMRVRKWVVKPAKQASAEEVFRFYCEAYERRFRRKVGGLKVQAVIRGNLGHLTKRVGVDEAKRAITTIMTSPKLRWVSSMPDSFLANRDNYDRHVGPVLSDRAGGEQSEYRGPVLTTSKTMTAEEFFSE